MFFSKEGLMTRMFSPKTALWIHHCYYRKLTKTHILRGESLRSFAMDLNIPGATLKTHLKQSDGLPNVK